MGVNLLPVVKWAGGKRQILDEIKSRLPEDYDRYYEPFVGGGALFFDLQPTSACINDLNFQLINLYRQIQTHAHELCDSLYVFEESYNSLEDMDSKDRYYYDIRDNFNNSVKYRNIPVLSAAMFIFLNKTCFNGLYRVNKDGLFNVPSGHKKNIRIFDRENLESMSEFFKGKDILCGDFEEACLSAEYGDFVFFDSPYYGTFDSYQQNGFTEDDHRRLFSLYETLSKRGVYCMLTNSSSAFIKELYEGYHIEKIGVKRSISANGTNRVGEEVIIRNY